MFILGTVQIAAGCTHLSLGNQWVFCVEINFYRAVTFNPRCNFPAQLNNFLFHSRRNYVKLFIRVAENISFLSERNECVFLRSGKVYKSIWSHILFSRNLNFMIQFGWRTRSLGRKEQQTEWIIFEIIYRFFGQNGSFRPLCSPWSRSHRWSESEEEESSGRWSRRGLPSLRPIPHWLLSQCCMPRNIFGLIHMTFCKRVHLTQLFRSASRCFIHVFLSVFYISPDIESCTSKEYLIIYPHLTCIHISECYTSVPLTLSLSSPFYIWEVNNIVWWWQGGG